MKLGILGAADIAFRRFLPALTHCPAFEFAGVASRSPDKARKVSEAFGGAVYSSYEDLLEDKSVEAVYLPFPPALHAEWGRRTLEAGKHLLMEKPFTTSAAQTKELLALAEKKGLAVHENYMFLYHSQLTKIRQLIADGVTGPLRLFRISFGFPMRGANDFRYVKALGGGALLDCGGYPIRLALELLGDSAEIVQADLRRPDGYEVDLYGNAVARNSDGLCAQISFGMDNAYQCALEVWGSRVTLTAPRVFTAGADFPPALILRSSSGEETLTLERDDQFLHSIERFLRSIRDADARKRMYAEIGRQARMQEAVFQIGGQNI